MTEMYAYNCYTMEHFERGKSKIGQGKAGKNQGICFLKLCGHPV